MNKTIQSHKNWPYVFVVGFLLGWSMAYYYIRRITVYFDFVTIGICIVAIGVVSRGAYRKYVRLGADQVRLIVNDNPSGISDTNLESEYRRKPVSKFMRYKWARDRAFKDKFIKKNKDGNWVLY